MMSAKKFSEVQNAPALTRLLPEFGLLILLSFIWGNSFVLMKIAVQSIPPLTLTAFRVALAAILLCGWMHIKGMSFRYDRRVWMFFFVQGLLQCAIPYTLISWGEQNIPSGLAGVLNATPPMFVLLIALFTGTRAHFITTRKIAGTLLGLAGVLVTLGYPASLNSGAPAPLSQLAVLCASFCYALSPMISLRHVSIPPLVVAAGSMACSALMMLPVAIVADRPWQLSPATGDVLAATVLAVVCTAFAMLVYFRLVGTLGALITASGGYLRAGFSVISGILFLGEALSWSVAAGMVLIVAGVVIVTLPGRRRQM